MIFKISLIFRRLFHVHLQTTPHAYKQLCRGARVRDTMSKNYDIIVFGATGNAGMAVAEYLANSVDIKESNKTWAIAGRNEAKLMKVRSKIGDEKTCGIVVADCNDVHSMVKMARQANVVFTSAGPYREYGEAVIAACLSAKTHYCDITGEVAWVKSMREKYDEKARKAGITLCSFAGYDCVPNEVSLSAAVSGLGPDYKLKTFESLVDTKGGAGFPRGTILTFLGFMGPRAWSTLMHESSEFVPEKNRDAYWRNMNKWKYPFYSKESKGYTLPNVMGPINIPVLQSTASTLGCGDMEINDRIPLPQQASRWYSLWGLAFIIPIYAIFVLVCAATWIANPLVRYLIAKNWGYYGEEKAVTSIKVYATGENAEGLEKKVSVRFTVPGDPGIKATAFMAAETTLAILEAGEELKSGVVTPVVAVGGEKLIERINSAGGSVELKEEN
ncbi:hypothetical protein AAMO2058_001272300 [Amorphochlora amoebiformis]